MNIESCGCGCTSHAERATLERPRYYPRQLLTPDDMTLEQDYFRHRLRLHNRFMHGWGVVCGAQVVTAEQRRRVIVKRGYVLGPFGDEIYIEKDYCLDVDKRCGGDRAMPDDECSDPAPPRPVNGEGFVAVRYVTVPTRRVRVTAGGCGCDDSVCEHSRWRDGFEICVLDHCPKSHLTPPEFDDVKAGPAPDCPPCPDEPWVVLAAISVADDGAVTVTPCGCRRQVLGFSGFWWSCTPPPPPNP